MVLLGLKIVGIDKVNREEPSEIVLPYNQRIAIVLAHIPEVQALTGLPASDLDEGGLARVLGKINTELEFAKRDKKISSGQPISERSFRTFLEIIDPDYFKSQV